MSVTDPAFKIPRQDLGTHAPQWVKLFDPPPASPVTPELLTPTNPVPEFMESLGLAKVAIPHTLQPDLLHGEDLTMWDGKKLKFFLFREKNLLPPFQGGHFPAPTIRVPRGVIFHAKTHGHGPPPHTIHWHGIEGTPINDGVGHCSMEIGDYTYQWQPNQIGTYFYHCHRNTVQHFKFGLYGALLIEPPNAFDQGPGKNPGGYPRRTTANLENWPKFPGFNPNKLDSGDPEAMTVPYDVEAFWAIDDTFSTWNEKMSNARAAFPSHGSLPGINDNFKKGDFHDFSPDYFFATGVNFPGRPGEIAFLPKDLTVPAALNSGVTGMQISVNAKVNQTILIRLLAGSYSNIKVKFPVDALIIAFDGRALGVPPYGQYNRPILLKAGDLIEITTARRFDVLLRESSPIDSFAEVQYDSARDEKLIFTGRIPIVIF